MGFNAISRNLLILTQRTIHFKRKECALLISCPSSSGYLPSTRVLCASLSCHNIKVKTGNYQWSKECTITLLTYNIEQSSTD